MKTIIGINSEKRIEYSDSDRLINHSVGTLKELGCQIYIVSISVGVIRIICPISWCGVPVLFKRLISLVLVDQVLTRAINEVPASNTQ